jgi:hypothetical protein
LESFANAESSELSSRFGLARRFGLALGVLAAKLVMTVVTAMMNAALAHNAAMMPAMVTAQGVSGSFRRSAFDGRVPLGCRGREGVSG